jgi:hypothetical protein
MIAHSRRIIVNRGVSNLLATNAVGAIDLILASDPVESLIHWN